MLQGLLGSDDEEQEDPKDYCKGEAWPGAQAAGAAVGGGTTQEKEGAGTSSHEPGGHNGGALLPLPPPRPQSSIGSLPQVATTL